MKSPLKNYQLTKNFSLYELIESDTAVRHGFVEQFNPPRNIITNLLALSSNILQPLRDAFGNPIYVSSGWRCERVNKFVGGRRKSQHLLGEAADLKLTDKASNKALFELIIRLNLPFDQLINEYDFSWIHVSFTTRRKPRKEILEIFKIGNRIVERPYKPS